MNETQELKVFGGYEISEVIKAAAEQANANDCEVTFTFNDIPVSVQPGDDQGTVLARWGKDADAARDAYLASPEYAKRQADAERERPHLESMEMVETASTETEMRVATVPTPRTPEQLAQYIASLVNRSHDYGTCVYAMSMAATAAYNYVASKEGCTGFQASCADMDILRRTRRIDGPFMLIKGEDALYPQYNLRGRLDEALAMWKPWLKEQAQKNLDTAAGAHPDVAAHWQKLAAMEIHNADGRSSAGPSQNVGSVGHVVYEPDNV